MTAHAEAPPTERRLLIATLAAANFAIGMGAFVLIGVLSPIAESFRLTEAQAGFVITAYALAYAVGSPVLVALTGGAARRTVLALGLATVAVASIAGATAANAEVLYASRVLAALGAGIVTPVAAGVAAAVSPPETRGKALAAAFLGITLAQVLGVPAGAWLGYTFGWETTLWLTAGLALAALAAILALTPTGLPFQASTLATLGEALTDLRTVLAVSFTVLVMAAVYVFYTYAAPVMEARMGYDREGVSLYLLAFGVGAVFGNLLGGALADRFGSYRTLVFVACAQILFLPFYSFLPAPDAVVFAHAVTWSICGWTFAASQQSRLVALAPGRSNVMLALNAAAIYVGVSLGSWLGGQAIRLYGIDALGLVGSGVAALALVVLVASERVGR